MKKGQVLLLLLLLTLILSVGCGDGANGEKRHVEGGITIFYKTTFDKGKDGFKGSKRVAQSLVESDISGKALKTVVKQKWAGPSLGFRIKGAKDLRVAFMAKGHDFRLARLNMFDAKAHDNTTPYGYRFLPDDKWVPVLYYVDRFRYNSRNRGFISKDADFTGLRFWGPEPAGHGETSITLDNVVIYRGPDTMAPGPIRDLSAVATPKGVLLKWTQPRDNAFPMSYVVSRAVGNGPFKKIGETHTTNFLDQGCGVTTCKYRVLAVDFERNLGPWSNVAVAKGIASPVRREKSQLEKDREEYAQHIRDVHRIGEGKVNRGLVCLFGDSLTGPTIYPYLVAGALGIFKVNAHGYAGQTTGWGLKNVEAKALDRDNPEFLLVMFGTNNVRGKMRSQKVFERWVDDLEGIVKKAEARGTVVILGTIPPRGFTDPESMPEKTFNQVLIKRARLLKVPVAYVFDAVQKAGDRHDYIWRDGVHWTAKGMEVAAKAWAKTFKQVEFVLRDRP